METSKMVMKCPRGQGARDRRRERKGRVSDIGKGGGEQTKKRDEERETQGRLDSRETAKREVRKRDAPSNVLIAAFSPITIIAVHRASVALHSLAFPFPPTTSILVLSPD